MLQQEPKILIATADVGLMDYLKVLLNGEGYNVFCCNEGNAVIDSLSTNAIDLFIVDFDNMNTIEACKFIRSNFTLRHIPVILLVKQEETMNKIKGIYAGADDYIEKPIQAGELLTRIKANLWRANRDLDANPLTKLPGNVTILRELEKRIKNKDKFCVGYCDLDKFKEYNDYYGFEWGDKVIKHTAWVISNALVTLGAANDFLGHIGGDDYIFITEWESVKDICEKIVKEFDTSIPSFYKEEDLKRGYIIVKNRNGKVTATSILSISIGVATNKIRDLTHVGQVIQVITELKNYAKTFSESIYIIDRRRN